MEKDRTGKCHMGEAGKGVLKEEKKKKRGKGKSFQRKKRQGERKKIKVRRILAPKTVGRRARCLIQK